MTEPTAAAPPARPTALKVAMACFLGTVLLGFGNQAFRLLTPDQTIMDLVLLDAKARRNDERNIPGLPEWARERNSGPTDEQLRERLEAKRPAILESVRSDSRQNAGKAAAVLLVPAVLLGLLFSGRRVAWILSVIAALLGSIAFGLQIAPSLQLATRIPHLNADLQLYTAIALTALMVVALRALLARSTRNHFKSRT